MPITFGSSHRTVCSWITPVARRGFAGGGCWGGTLCVGMFSRSFHTHQVDFLYFGTSSLMLFFAFSVRCCCISFLLFFCVQLISSTSHLRNLEQECAELQDKVLCLTSTRTSAPVVIPFAHFTLCFLPQRWHVLFSLTTACCHVYFILLNTGLTSVSYINGFFRPPRKAVVMRRVAPAVVLLAGWDILAEPYEVTNDLELCEVTNVLVELCEVTNILVRLCEVTTFSFFPSLFFQFRVSAYVWPALLPLNQ